MKNSKYRCVILIGIAPVNHLHTYMVRWWGPRHLQKSSWPIKGIATLATTRKCLGTARNKLYPSGQLRGPHSRELHRRKLNVFVSGAKTTARARHSVTDCAAYPTMTRGGQREPKAGTAVSGSTATSSAKMSRPRKAAKSCLQKKETSSPVNGNRCEDAVQNIWSIFKGPIISAHTFAGTRPVQAVYGVRGRPRNGVSNGVLRGRDPRKAEQELVRRLNMEI